jgi:hypothetical protein
MDNRNQNFCPEAVSGCEPLLVSAVQASQLLSISQRTLFALTKSGVVPHRRLSNRVLYSPDELRDWIAKGCKVAMRDALPEKFSLS